MVEKVKLADELYKRLHDSQVAPAIADLTPDDASFIVDNLSYIIMDALAKDKVVLIPSVVRLSLVTHKERTGHNPSTNKPMTIPEHTAPNAHFSRNLRELLYNVKHEAKKK